MYVVYGLVNPLTHQMFYVGMTKDMYSRYIQHLNLEGNNKAKNKVILSLKNAHVVPVIWTLAVAQTIEEARRLEAFYIDKERLLQQPLTNQTLWTGYEQEAWEKEELEHIAGQLHQAKTFGSLKGILGFIYRLLEPYLVGKALYDARYPRRRFNVKDIPPEVIEEKNRIIARLKSGEEPSAIVRSYEYSFRYVKQEFNELVQLMAQQISTEERN